MDELLIKIREDIGNIMEEITDLAPNEIEEYFISGIPIDFPEEGILMISLFGSRQHKFNYKRFLKTYTQDSSDLDIGIIIDDGITDLKTESKTINIDIGVSMGAYSSKTIGQVKYHYFIISKKEYLKGIKDGKDTCLALKNGKKIYVKDLDTRKELLN